MIALFRTLLLAGLFTGCGGDSSAVTDSSTGPDAHGSDVGRADPDAADAAARFDAALDARLQDGSRPADSGLSWPDSGAALPPPERAELTVGPLGSCPVFEACGGDVVGVWDTHGGCFEVDVESAIARCPGAMVTRRSGQGRGRVSFSANGFAHRVAEAVIEVDVRVPAICARFVSCEMVEAAMTAMSTEATCTTEASGDCSCTARQVTIFDHSGPYETDGNEIVAVGSDARWEFCIEGNRFDYSDSSRSGPREPGVVQLRRR